MFKIINRPLKTRVAKIIRESIKIDTLSSPPMNLVKLHDFYNNSKTYPNKNR